MLNLTESRIFGASVCLLDTHNLSINSVYGLVELFLGSFGGLFGGYSLFKTSCDARGRSKFIHRCGSSKSIEVWSLMSVIIRGCWSVTEICNPVAETVRAKWVNTSGCVGEKCLQMSIVSKLICFVGAVVRKGNKTKLIISLRIPLQYFTRFGVSAH